MAPDLVTNMRATTEALVMAFDRPWAEGAREAAVAPRAPECEHFMLPSSLGSAAKNNDEWAAYFKHVENRVLEAKVSSALLTLPKTAAGLTEWADDYTRLPRRAQRASSGLPIVHGRHYNCRAVQERVCVVPHVQ